MCMKYDDCGHTLSIIDCTIPLQQELEMSHIFPLMWTFTRKRCSSIDNIPIFLVAQYIKYISTVQTPQFSALNLQNTAGNFHSGLLWWLSSKEPSYKYRIFGLNPWVRKVPWRRKWQPTPVFLPEKSHRQRSQVGYSPCGPKDSVTKQNCITTKILFMGRWMIENEVDKYLLVWYIYNKIYLSRGISVYKVELNLVFP